jgi:hypothetical protein
MGGLWGSLAPLIIGSALVPVQIAITLLLLRSSAGRVTAVAWVGGMTVVRLAQGLVFGLVLSASDSASGDAKSGHVVAGILLVVGVLFYVTAIRQILHADDPDEPPPKWLAMTESMTPRRAFLVASAILTIGVKFWVFTLAAIAAIGDANLSRTASIATFLLYIVLAESIHLAILGFAYIAPERSAVALDGAASWLRDHNRMLMTVLGLVFGTWFVVKALNGLGVV